MFVNEKTANVSCFKFVNDGNFWSVIAAKDEYAAKDLFMSEYKRKETCFNNDIKMERVNFSYKIRSPFFPNPISVGILVGVCKFMPRVLSDSYDQIDSDYQLKPI